uniref:Sulfotransferase n=1 Tax=Plectus sambesii TaxID=2011161 RepID=A0A914W7Y4_9BILA
MRMMRSALCYWLLFIVLVWGLGCLTIVSLGARSSTRVDDELNERSEQRAMPVTEAVTHFVYLPPPKTGSMITRQEMRRFCSDHSLNCLGQSWPCPSSPELQLCLMEDARVKGQLDDIFWSAFTAQRLKICCSVAYKMDKFDASLFHSYMADPPTRDFIHNHTYSDALWLTMLRDPVDQYISFFNFVTRSHQYIYGRYMNLINAYNRTLELEPTVNAIYVAVKNNSLAKLPARYLHLHRTLQNIQSRILGWNGKGATLQRTIDSLDDFAFVGITEQIERCWQLIRDKLRWPNNYFPAKRLLRQPTTYNITSALRAKIRLIQHADVRLYDKAVKIFRKY